MSLDRFERVPLLFGPSPVHRLDGLAPAQVVRIRVRALGDGWGPFSEEVMGRAQ